jgi:hypothetical protein
LFVLQLDLQPAFFMQHLFNFHVLTGNGGNEYEVYLIEPLSQCYKAVPLQKNKPYWWNDFPEFYAIKNGKQWLIEPYLHHWIEDDFKEAITNYLFEQKWQARK